MLDINQNDDRQVVELLKALGKAYLENGENQKATDKFRHLVNNGIVDPEILMNYALSLAGIEAINDEALAIYQNAVAADADNETLYLSLAALFLKKNIIKTPALKVFGQALNYAPPFQDEIHSFIERIFRESTDTTTTPELRNTLLDSVENPEILTLYLTTAWKNEKYDEALYILKDLYKRSNQNPIYLNAICQTLLEKKAWADDRGLSFQVTSSDVEYCLKFKDINNAINRIHEIELYLDFKNLFLNLSNYEHNPSENHKELKQDPLQNALNNLNINSDIHELLSEKYTTFNLVHDLIEKNNLKLSFNALKSVQEQSSISAISTDLLNQLNSLAIFEITNFDTHPEHSKLPFTTFIKLTSGEFSHSEERLICTTDDGLFIFSVNPGELFNAAVETLQKLDRYNQVVEDSEKITLRVTLHSSPVPLMNLENEGLKVLRQGFKVHNMLRIGRNGQKKLDTDANGLFTTEQMSDVIKGSNLKNLGQFTLPYFPQQHQIYQVILNNKAEKTPMDSTHKFGKYEVSETIKTNQLYSTFRGYDAQLERSVIIKAYNSQAFSNYKDSARLEKQFFDEVRRLNRINHPNIGVIYDAGEENGLLYLVREYCQGHVLNDYLQQDGLPNVHHVLEYYFKIFRALSYYHHTQIWHKNLKPDNIFVTPQKEIKITDGGILQVHNTDEIVSDDLNSLSYSSPEQIQGTKLTQCCDIFQLGVVLYESVTGAHPFKAESASQIRIRILADNPRPAIDIRPDIPEFLDGILKKALSKSPEHRYQSIKAFARDLQRVYENSNDTSSKGLL